MFDLSKFSLNNLEKIQRVLQVILDELEFVAVIRPIGNKIPIKSFLWEGLSIEEVKKVFRKLDETELIELMHDDENLTYDKYESEDDKPKTLKNFHNLSEEDLKNNIIVRIDDLDGLKKMKLDIDEMIVKNTPNANQKEYIKQIICVNPNNESNRFLMIINNDYQNPIVGDTAKPSWDLLFQIANNEEIKYDEAINKNHLYYLQNEQNQLYTKTKYCPTKILKADNGLIIPNIKISAISEKTYKTRINKSD